MNVKQIFVVLILCLTGFRMYAQSPGGVSGGLMMWLKADAGTTVGGVPSVNNGPVDAWADMSGSGNSLTSTFGVRPYLNWATTAPASKVTYFNFNPVLGFNGSGTTYMRKTDFVPPASALSTFTVAHRHASGDGGFFRWIWNMGDFNNFPSLVDWSFGNQGTPSIYRGGSNASNQMVGGRTMGYYYVTRSNVYGGFFTKGPSAGSSQMTVNGSMDNEIGTNNSVLGRVSPTYFILGTSYNNDGGDNYYGNIGEHIMYDVNLSNTTLYPNHELDRVNSYLAIKYGATLVGGTADAPVFPFVATNYYNSQSQVIWSGAGNPNYHHNVAGIMRDDASGLSQRQSVSNNGYGSAVAYSHPNGQAIIALGSIATSNAANTGSFGADLQSMVWGDNDVATNLSSAPVSFTWNGSSSNIRGNRIWRVENNGVNNMLQISLHPNNWGVTATGCQRLVVLVASDAAFTNIVDAYPVTDEATASGLENIGSTKRKLGDMVFPSGVSYFTVARIENFSSSVPFLLSASTGDNKITASTGSCGYYDYNNPSNSAQKLVQINPNGNVTFTSGTPTVTVSNSAQSYDAGGQIGYYNSGGIGYSQMADGTNTLRMGWRLTSIVAPGSFATNGGVKVRVYYNPAELSQIVNNPVTGNPIIKSGWFKSSKHTPLEVLQDMNYSTMQISGATEITPSSTGVENGVNYAEFLLQSFSTIGFYAGSLPQVLPVSFGDISAILKNGQLVVNWSTLSERNVDRFEVEASADGKVFHTIGTAPSKAIDRKSDGTLSYDFSIDVAGLGAGLAGVLFLFAGFTGRRRRAFAGILVITGIAFFTVISCNKHEVPLSTDVKQLFVRIKQVDKDGSYAYSKAVQVIQR